MKLSDAIKYGIPLVVITPEGGLRYAAELFELPLGVAFLDIGWDQASTHACHLLTGELEGEGPWAIGSATIRVLEETDSVVDDMMLWESYRLSPEGRGATREAAQQYLNTTYQENSP